ncbi:MAG TPA: spore coat U domain-containing protein [Steroidobacteraceae bacterium]|nr:spore coat U domain-containing protein [Steroidobacteraceae bacterium]
MRNSIASLSAGALLALAGAAQAAPPNPATTNIGVSATVTKNCTVGATPVAFGAYYPTAGALTANSTVSVNCTKTTPFTVSLNKGTTAGGSIAQRLLTDGGGNTLQYNLYKDAAMTVVWGDGTGSSQTNAGAGAGMATAVQFTAYGSLPDVAFNQGTQPPGLYQDTVTVSVAY